MFYALDKNNIKVHISDADHDKFYFCQICNQNLKLVSECQRNGKKIREHFSHIGKPGSESKIYIPCTDRWHYCKTEWHCAWQNKFPEECRECVVSNGKQKHIADVLINNTVIEFQHSDISVEEFRERNEFYTECGYKVIWIFDFIEEFDQEKIYQVNNPGQNTYKYRWLLPKKMFRQLDLNKEKATVIFQFFNENNEYYELEELINGYNEFREFYTKNVYSICDFLNLIINENFWNRKISYKPSQEQIDQVKDGKTVLQLWQNDYFRMAIENQINGNEMIIEGDKGVIKRKDGKISGKYSNRTISGEYKYSDFYIVWDAESPVWKLKRYWERTDIEYQVQKIDDTISKYSGCDSLTNIISQNRIGNIIVHCLYNDKTYVVNFIDDIRYNAFQIDFSSGEILSLGCENYFVYPFRNKKFGKSNNLKMIFKR